MKQAPGQSAKLASEVGLNIRSLAGVLNNALRDCRESLEMERTYENHAENDGSLRF